MRNPILEKELDPGYHRILGMDEAGRGPIAGPLVVAGVIFPVGYEHPEIDDSKKLSEKKRRRLFSQILQDALWYQIRFVEEEKIDALNIYAATRQTMNEIALASGADFVLSDAMPLDTDIPFEAVVKGDQKSVSIAAASILAKVSRDLYMEQLDRLYPQYGLKQHKGYPTKAHLQAIEQYGVNEHYRKSYTPVARILKKADELTLF